MLAFGFGLGTQIIVARRDGEGQYAEIGRTIEHSYYILVPFSLLAFLFMEWGADVMLRNIIQSQNVLLATTAYLDYRSFGIFFAFINMGFRAFYVGIARTKVITWTTIVLATVNIIMDYALIFGNLGMPEMGIEGAAIASVTAEFSACLFFLLHTLFKMPLKHYQLFYFRKFSRRLLSRILRVATPIMLQHFLSLGNWLVFFLFVEQMGERPLAISNIIRSFYIVLMIPIWGFASATNTLVSNLIGQNKSDEVMPVVYKTLMLCVSGILVLVLSGLLIPGRVLSIYTDSKELIEGAIPVLHIVSGAAILLGGGFIFFSGVSGTGKTQISLTIEIITILMYLFAAYLLVIEWQAGITAVWSTEFIYALLLGSLSWLYLKSGKWRKAKI
jgi:putative MATE family efflux protein